MKPSELSCVIITLNEQQNIADCIASARQVADEIIIVDADSIDKTRDIASANDAIVIKKSWTGYADARNAGHENARNNYILALDADERLSEELITSIKNLVPDKHTVYRLDMLPYFAGTPVYYSGWRPIHNDRLYNRTTAQWEGDYVHEKLIPAHLNRKLLKGVAHHYTYTSVEDHNKRMERYAYLGAKKLFAKDKKYSSLLKYLKAGFRYFRTLVLKKGVLDGKLGFYIAKQNYRMILMKYNFLKEIEHAHKQKTETK